MKEHLSVREKARRRDGGIGKLGTHGVIYRVWNWNTAHERIEAVPCEWQRFWDPKDDDNPDVAHPGQWEQG